MHVFAINIYKKENYRLKIKHFFELKIVFNKPFFTRNPGKTWFNALDTLNAVVHVAPYLLKVLAVLADTAVRSSAVDPEELNPY